MYNFILTPNKPDSDSFFKLWGVYSHNITKEILFGTLLQSSLN